MGGLAIVIIIPVCVILLVLNIFAYIKSVAVIYLLLTLPYAYFVLSSVVCMLRENAVPFVGIGLMMYFITYLLVLFRSYRIIKKQKSSVRRTVEAKI
jgi:hypothetical protein